MTSARQLFVAAALALSVLPLERAATAGPTVIRDEALQDLAVTPVLGRGYSIATNTFQSICYTDIVKTKPSYNFRYNFQEISEEQSQSLKKTGSISGSYSGGGFGVRVSASASAKKAVKTASNTFKQNLLVSIDIDVYYSSIDESKGHFAPAALSLIKKKDLPSFFDACGMYYTRSINRSARFVSVFSYETQTESRDEAFEAQLQATVKGWGQSASVSASSSREFSSKASSMRLTIESHGFGLGKSESASLISYDLDTFRAAIKMAFQAMQAEDVGMVTSIEVAPWVEHAEFQDALELTQKEVDDPKCASQPAPSDGSPPPTCPKITRTAYEQKRLLVQNAEFLSEVDRAARTKLNVYYRAKQCSSGIKLDFKQLADDGITWSWMQRPEEGTGDWSTAEVVNHRTNKWDRKLADVDAAVVPLKLNTIFKEYDAFMYGGSDDEAKWPEFAKEANIQTSSTSPTFQEMSVYGFYTPTQFPGAARCVKDMLADDRILTGSYRNLATCARVEEQFGVVQGQTVNDYCMPQTR